MTRDVVDMGCSFSLIEAVNRALHILLLHVHATHLYTVGSTCACFFFHSSQEDYVDIRLHRITCIIKAMVIAVAGSDTLK